MTQVPTPPSQPVPAREVPGATASLVLGILSIVLGGCAPVGLVLGFVGLNKARAAKAYVQQNPGTYSNAGLAQGGYICSIVGLVLGCISMLIWLFYIAIIVIAIASGAA